jgi:hypothetical protein
MQLHIFTFTTLALAGVAAALPRFPVSGNHTHGVSNFTTNLTTVRYNTTRAAPRNSTRDTQSNASDTDDCTTLCSLQAQICTIALPTQDDYW